MKEYFKLMGVYVAFLFIVLVILCILNLAGFLGTSWLSPALEKVRYTTFKESQSYNDGMIRDLENLKISYLQSNPEQQVALKSIIVHRFSVYDISKLPPDLQNFYFSINH